jgi:hypothetical protein
MLPQERNLLAQGPEPLAASLPVPERPGVWAKAPTTADG